MSKKYFWVLISWSFTGSSVYSYEESVIDIHPFEYLKETKKISGFSGAYLVNWKEITKEEFDLFGTILN